MRHQMPAEDGPRRPHTRGLATLNRQLASIGSWHTQRAASRACAAQSAAKGATHRNGPVTKRKVRQPGHERQYEAALDACRRRATKAPHKEKQPPTSGSMKRHQMPAKNVPRRRHTRGLATAPARTGLTSRAHSMDPWQSTPKQSLCSTRCPSATWARRARRTIKAADGRPR